MRILENIHSYVPLSLLTPTTEVSAVEMFMFSSKEGNFASSSFIYLNLSPLS